ncbi:MAG: hypothetical protein K5776_07190 [Lachnospiraceae bacterium]|nr:hypothetical protein [Lachnospiraceae bacterium]
MAAISGILLQDTSQSIPENTKDCIRKITGTYKTDRFEEILASGLYLTCGHQYFTNEAVNDISPACDKKTNTYYTGDVFLFNRDGLISFLASRNGIEEEFLATKGDAELVFYAYRFLGPDFLNHIKGIFSMAICDLDKKHCYLITDHVAQRHLAYTFKDNALFFSNSMEILTELLGNDAELDEEWLCNAYGDMSPATGLLKGRCFLKNVFRVFPGTYVDIDLSTFSSKEVTYWNPLNIKERKDLDDEGFKKLFVDTFRNCVTSTLRARKNHGVLLSGGLDSSSIASFAAEQLGKEGKTLFSYTQVPMPDYKPENSPFYIENETKEVLYNKEKYPNIECRFIYPEKGSCISFIEKSSEIFKEPLKSVVNEFYFHELHNAAVNDDCSIIYNGQFGNATISYGRIFSYVHQKAVSFRFIKALKEANAFCTSFPAKRFRLLKAYLRILWHRLRISSNLMTCFLRKDKERLYAVKKREIKILRSQGCDSADTKKRRRNFIFMPVTFQDFGYYDTCSSFYFGFLSIDPTLSKDMIELCLSMPIDCFVKNGKERRAVRDYLKGIVSDKILDNVKRRGAQAADYAYRVSKYFDSEKDLLFSYLKYPKLYDYLDKEKIEKLIEKIKETKYNIDKETVVLSAVAASFGCFLKNWDERKRKKEKNEHGINQTDKVQT